MKFKGYYFGETRTGKARWISATRELSDAIPVPISQTTAFRLTATERPEELPRETFFTVTSWLSKQADFQKANFMEV
jgi:hypothetical protein